MFSQLSWIVWLLLFFVFVLLGLNIYFYLTQNPQYITQKIQSIVASFSNLFGSSGSSGSSGSTTATATPTKQEDSSSMLDTISTKVDSLQQTPGKTANHIGSSTNQETSPTYNNNEQLLNTQQPQKQQQQQQQPPSQNYEADDSHSSIQSSKATNKSGWCFIGEDRGFRSCIQVGENDTCMSGDIFPSSEICINPNLRE